VSSRPVPLRGHDHHATVRLTPEEARHGKTLKLDVAHDDGTRTVAVTLPAGLRDGQQLHLAGEGHPGRHGGPAGDIYLDIRIVPRA
jgi:curved DNA-binding protein